MHESKRRINRPVPCGSSCVRDAPAVAAACLPATRWTAFAAIALLLAAANVPAWAQRPPALVVGARATEREITAGQTFVGTVMPSRHAVIGSAVDGRVIEFPFNEGDRVEARSALAQLLTDTIQLELKAAEAELEFRQQQLAELEHGARPEEIEQARARAAAAAARRTYQQKALDRTRQAFASGRASSEDQVDAAEATAIESAENAVDAEEAYELVKQGPRAETIAQARAQLAMQQAVVDRLRDQISKHTVISRFPGYVVAEHTEEGQWVRQGDPVAEVAALDVVEIVVPVVEQSIPFLELHGQVPVEIPSLAGRTLTGEVAAIVPQADVRARTFPVKIRVANEIGRNGPLIKAGMYARVTLPTGSLQKAVLVPKDAVVLGGRQPIVYVVAAEVENLPADVAPTPVPVELGVSTGDLIQATGAVQPGQLVIVQGNERLAPGQPAKLVRIADSAVSAPKQ